MDEFDKCLDLVEELAKSTLDVVKKFRQSTSDTKARAPRTYKFEYVETILQNARKPLHIDDIIDIAGKEYNANINKDSLSSAISKKIRSGSNITRTAPNTFEIKEV